jgi:hypothetical protein
MTDKELVFYIRGFAAVPYKVTFRKNGENLSAYCTCPAGDNGQYYKHRFNILGGFSDGIISGNGGDVAIVTSWLPGTDVESAIDNVMDAEEQFKSAKVKLSTAKKRLAKAFRD